MDSSFGDFLRQVPIGFLLAPLLFGGLYVVTMVVIFRRASARRRARALAMGKSTETQSRMSTGSNRPLSFLPVFLTKGSADKPVALEALRGLPEPDLDSLVSAGPALAEPVLALSADLTPPAPSWLPVIIPSADIEETSAPEPLSAESKELPAMPSKPSDPTGAVEVMRVWRDLSDGSLLIELDGQRFHAPREIGSADLARRFVSVVRELSTMANTGMPSRAPDPGSPADREAETNYVPPSIPGTDLKSPGMLRTLGRTVTSQPEMRSAGIADAVEDYLQFKLSHTPEFQQRSIHVRPSFDGGVRIEVDGRSYNGVGDVVDPDVREFLISTFHEWEARQ